MSAELPFSFPYFVTDAQMAFLTDPCNAQLLRDMQRETLEKAVAACNEIADGPDQFNGSCRGAIRMAAKRIKAVAGGTSQT